MNKTVLVVDDESDIRVLVREILEEEGYRVSVAGSAEAARAARTGFRRDPALPRHPLPPKYRRRHSLCPPANF